MKQLQNFINEKLKINSKSKVNIKRILSKNMSNDFYFNFQLKSPEDLNETERDIQAYVDTDNDPNDLLEKVTYKEQLFSYWFYSVMYGYEEGADLFRTEIINKKYATEDEIDTAAITLYDTCEDKYKINIENYLERYNIQIKED